MSLDIRVQNTLITSRYCVYSIQALTHLVVLQTYEHGCAINKYLLGSGFSGDDTLHI